MVANLPGNRTRLRVSSGHQPEEEGVAAAYSLDLRRRVVETVAEGVSRRQAAELFRLGVSTVIRWARRVAETGSYAAVPSGGDHKSKDIEVHKEWLLGQQF